MSIVKSLPRQISQEVLEEACEWFIDFNEGELDAAGRERFNQWLRRSPGHVQAYLEIAATWQDSSRLLGAQRAEPAAPPRRSMWSVRAQRAWLLPSLAACALVAVGIAFLRDGNTYATGAGELRSVMLDDGSTAELDTRSQVRVRFSRDERTVQLLKGQALFSVKKDAARPFVVVSSGTRVRVVGTQFDVYRKAIGTTVTVIEGRIAVTGPAASIVLSAGEQVTLTPRSDAHVVPADLAAVTAWTQRKLIFNEASLSEVVAEFNRYNTRQIILEDTSLLGYHIRGHFDASDPQKLLQFLRDRFNVDVRERGDEIHISRK